MVKAIFASLLRCAPARKSNKSPQRRTPSFPLHASKMLSNLKPIKKYGHHASDRLQVFTILPLKKDFLAFSLDGLHSRSFTFYKCSWQNPLPYPPKTPLTFQVAFLIRNSLSFYSPRQALLSAHCVRC